MIYIEATYLYYNDLWSFDISLGMWRLRGGTNTPNSPGMFPNHVGDEGGWPPSRYRTVSWTSDDGLLFLFGGAFGKFFLLIQTSHKLQMFNIIMTSGHIIFHLEIGHGKEEHQQQIHHQTILIK